MLEKIASASKLQPSNARIKPYSGQSFQPLGKQVLACEGATSYEMLDFEVIDSDLIPNKPALLSGKDSKRLGLITFNQDKVFASSTSEIKPPMSVQDCYVHAVTNTVPQEKATDLIPGNITEKQLKSVYKSNFEGLGKIGEPLHIET